MGFPQNFGVPMTRVGVPISGNDHMWNFLGIFSGVSLGLQRGSSL